MNKKYAFILIVIFSISCINQNKDNNNIVEEVFKDVFVKLVDSTTTDFRRIIGPSQKDLSNEESKKQFHKKIDSLKKIKLPPLKVVIEDSLYKLNFTQNEYILRHNFNKEDFDYLLKNKDLIKDNDLDFDINMFSNNKFKFVYKQDSSNARSLSKFGKYSFSELHFNKAKNVCVFNYGLYYSKLNGSNFLCILKKEKDNWQIYKIIEISIS